MNALIERAIAATTARYQGAGRFDRGFVEGKLRRDPVYRAVCELSLPMDAVAVDLGCGRGFLLALLLEMERLRHPEASIDSTAAPRWIGIEGSRRHAAVARQALGEDARIEILDVASCVVPVCDVALLVDVLHYLPAPDQTLVLERVHLALRPTGSLVVREIDTDGGWRALAAQASERALSLARGHLLQRFHFRSAGEWRRMLEQIGFEVESVPMGAGTPFANVMLVARRPPTG